MNRNENHPPADDTGDLRPLVEALRAEVPEDCQFEEARARLLARLDVERPAVARRELPGRTSSRPGRRRWPLVAGFAAAIGLAAVVLGLVSHRWPQERREAAVKPLARVAMLHGECSRFGSRGEEVVLSPGASLHAGDRLRVGPSSALRVRTDDKSDLFFGPGTETVWLEPRSATGSAIRLIRGEMRAAITRGSDEVFAVETPAAALRALGTEFDVRVLPGIHGNRADEEANMSVPNPIQLARTFVVLTVLSGAVAVQAAGQEQIVEEGERTSVAAGGPISAAEKVPNVEYLRHWLGKRLTKSDRARPQEVLAATDLRRGVLQAFSAVDAESGKARHLASFLASNIAVQARAGNQLAIVTAESPLWLYGVDPVRGLQHPLGGSTAYFVDIQSGEKLRIEPLDDFRVGHAVLSPDWRQLAFVGFGYRRTPEEPDRYGLYVLNLETMRVTALPKGLAQDFDWSPDSRWLASSITEDKTSQVVLWDSISGDLKRTDWKGMLPRFSPDGKHLVFVEGMHGFGPKTQRSATESWNLARVELPEGKPAPITALEGRAAAYPCFSPDGTRLLYWESEIGEWDLYGTKVLHDLDLRGGQDRQAATLYFSEWGPPAIQWLDEDSKAAFRMAADVDMALVGDQTGTLGSQPYVLKYVNLAPAQPTVRDVDLPVLSGCLQGGDRTAADELAEGFAAFHAGTRAELLHVLDEAAAQYARGRDMLAAARRQVEQGEGKLGLQPAEIRPFHDLLAGLAAMEKEQRSVSIVREALETAMPQILSQYYCGFTRLPPEDREKAIKHPLQRSELVVRQTPSHRLDLEECARQAPGSECLVKMPKVLFSCLDLPVVRRVFLVPGDDPDKAHTSFEVVQPDRGEGVLVIRTPVLAHGKRFEATYRIQEKYRSSFGTEVVRIEAEVAEVE